MQLSEIIFGTLLVLSLLGIAVYVGGRQLGHLRALRGSELPVEEQSYIRHKAWRRLLNSGLMLILAGMLATLMLSWPEVSRRIPLPGEERIVDPLVRWWGWGWVVLLLILLVVLLLAGLDLWSIRRFGVKQLRKLQADRRAMIERQANRLRGERNGHG